MFDPKCRLLLTTESFPEDQVICLGSQLILIINVLKKILPLHTWYGADVQAVGKGVADLNVSGFRLKLIGSDQQFASYCLNISQFIWGVFVCIDNGFLSSSIMNVELETEDEPYRPIPCDGILIEIRMFDTSYIEIYSEDESIIKRISDNFMKSKFYFKS